MQVDSHITREVQLISSLKRDLKKTRSLKPEQMGKELDILAKSLSVQFQVIPLLMSALDNITRNAIYYGKDQVDVQFHVVQDQLDYLRQWQRWWCAWWWTRFYLSDLSTVFLTARDRNSGGTGLGLTITESAIRQHSGTITAQP